MTAGAPAPPEISVLIARASLQDSRRIEQTLRSLRAQVDAPAFEVIVVDRVGDGLALRMENDYALRWLAAPATTALPRLRWQALQAARGRIAVVTEDHCIAPPDWLARIAAEFRRRPEAAVVAGGVANGLTASAFDWATYLCEYASFAPPLAGGSDGPVVGTHTAYRRDILAAQPLHALTDGFWEITVHPRLTRAGHLLWVSGDLIVHHCKRFTLRGFLSQRFLYSRHYAGARFARRGPVVRAAAAATTVLLPPLLIGRLLRQLAPRRALWAPGLRAAPYLLLFYLVWACGELVGYAAGAGDALRRIE